MMNLSPKVLAYLRASEVIARARAEAGVYDRSIAAAINKELKCGAAGKIRSKSIRQRFAQSRHRQGPGIGESLC